MKKIKLSKEVLDVFIRCGNTRGSCKRLLLEIETDEQKAWTELKNKYPKLNFTGSSIKVEENVLLLPFENFKHEGDIK
jgi:hypothetical protein